MPTTQCAMDTRLQNKKSLFCGYKHRNLESPSLFRREGGDVDFIEMMSHLALITTLQMTNGVITCLPTCACAVRQGSYTAACSLDSTCNQFGLLSCYDAIYPGMSTWLPFKRGNPERTPVKLCAKSHGQTNTASVLFSKDWHRTSCWSHVENFALQNPLWRKQSTHPEQMQSSCNSFKRSEYVKCKSQRCCLSWKKNKTYLPD